MTVANNAGLTFYAERNRKCVFEVPIGEADLDDALIASDDNVRVKIGRNGQAPLLEIQSASATDNGSICTAANPTIVTIAAGDMTFAAGIYDMEVLIIDKSEANAPKKAETGVFVLRESFGGDVGLT